MNCLLRYEKCLGKECKLYDVIDKKCSVEFLTGDIEKDVKEDKETSNRGFVINNCFTY